MKNAILFLARLYPFTTLYRPDSATVCSAILEDSKLWHFLIQDKPLPKVVARYSSDEKEHNLTVRHEP